MIPQSDHFELRRYGDRAFIALFDQVIDPKLSQSIHLLTHFLNRHSFEGIKVIVPAFCSLTVIFEPKQTTSANVLAWMKDQIDRFANAEQDQAGRVGKQIEVPVCYDPEFALDRDELIARTGLDWSTIVRAHAEETYTGMMSGFHPGFCYLASVPKPIRCSRKSSPRKLTTAGSVGIADSLTAVYPLDAPGGWTILGRTPRSMYTQQGEDFLIRPGDQIQFRSISKSDFEKELLPPNLSRPSKAAAESSTELEFLMPGIQTTIQDGGRSGYQIDGVPFGGPMDQRSAASANRLVGNLPDAPLIEITLLGPVIRFSNATSIAITGADLSPSIDGKPIPMQQRCEVLSGSVLRFGNRKSGCRSYLAVAGNVTVPKWLGSCAATFPFANMWTPESVVSKHQTVSIASTSPDSTVSANVTDLPDSSPPDQVIRVWPGPEFEQFTNLQRQRFIETEFTLSVDANRMGYRLGPSILEPGETSRHPWQSGILSSTVIPGVIQVPPSGEPIVLMRDAQTSGGYARLGVVEFGDLDRLAQLRPGDRCRFQWVNRPAESL